MVCPAICNVHYIDYEKGGNLQRRLGMQCHMTIAYTLYQGVREFQIPSNDIT